MSFCQFFHSNKLKKLLTEMFEKKKCFTNFSLNIDISFLKFYFFVKHLLLSIIFCQNILILDSNVFVLNSLDICQINR